MMTKYDPIENKIINHYQSGFVAFMESSIPEAILAFKKKAIRLFQLYDKLYRGDRKTPTFAMLKVDRVIERPNINPVPVLYFGEPDIYTGDLIYTRHQFEIAEVYKVNSSNEKGAFLECKTDSEISCFFENDELIFVYFEADPEIFNL